MNAEDRRLLGAAADVVAGAVREVHDELRTVRLAREEREHRPLGKEPRRVGAGVLAAVPGFWELWVDEHGAPRRVPAARVAEASLVRGRRRAWVVLCHCGEGHVVPRAGVAWSAGCSRAFLGCSDGVAVRRFEEVSPMPSDAEVMSEIRARHTARPAA